MTPVALPWFPKRILVSHTLHEGLGEYLTARRPDLEVRARDAAEIGRQDVEWCEVFVGFRPPREGPWRELRWIHCIGAGVDAFAFRTGLAPHTLLTRTSEDFGPMIGEYCLARALAVTQRLRLLEGDQRAKLWRPKHPSALRGTRTLIVGTGAVGRGIARALLGANCVVDGLSRSGTPREPFAQVYAAAQFAQAVHGAHWLILACPLTEETFHFLDRARLAACLGTYLINVGRGPLVEESALPEALLAGQLAGCALDVFETEPLPASSPLWEHPEVTISPHISGLTTIPGAAAGFLACLAEVEAGQRPALAVDSQRGY
ncbi:MAG TPA: D-2-hydroxyacid dehydrogenase [Gemmatimonadales bacterium]|jgi:phosphoglycerate dehydrogenase-like enzyme|nr:D-2-hydroxyacid dehydrogenase [Gemmatimonadales bacterium]